MDTRFLVLICLILVTFPSHAQLLDPCCDSSPPWTICTAGSFSDSAPCSPASPSCGSYAYYYSNGDGDLNEKGIYQCQSVVPAVYEIYAHFDMGLPTPNGAGSVFRLRVAPGPVTCGSLCNAGDLLYSSNTHNCGSWNDTGVLTYVPPTAGSYCLIAVGCGNEGWSCGALLAIDDLDFHPPGPAVEDWVLY
jgi:hypothetical protein